MHLCVPESVQEHPQKCVSVPYATCTDDWLIVAYLVPCQFGSQ